MSTRREFIGVLGGAVIWPVVGRTQQVGKIPIVGTIHPTFPEINRNVGFVNGLRDEGFVESQNVMIEHRSAGGDFDKLPTLTAELLRSRVSVLATFGTAVEATIKAARSDPNAANVPIVFSFGGDPVAKGYVASLNRPGGNITGSTSIGFELGPKRLELMRTLLPGGTTIALLSNPENPSNEAERRDLAIASSTLGWRLRFLEARSGSDFEQAFATVVQQRIDALIISVDTHFYGQSARLAEIAAHHRVPTIGPLRRFAAAGGLMSFGTDIPEANRHAGVYVGKILKGAKPADLPVMQPTKFELVVNLNAAKALGLDIPIPILLRADEVIE